MRHRAAFWVARFVEIDHVPEDAVLVGDSFREAAVLAAEGDVLTCIVIGKPASAFGHQPEPRKARGEMMPVHDRSGLPFSHSLMIEDGSYHSELMDLGLRDR